MTDLAPPTDSLADASLTGASLTGASLTGASLTDDAFTSPVAMENDQDRLFAGDSGVLDPEVRRVLVRLLQRRFLLADKNRGDWSVLLDNQQLIESRLNDLFLRLEVDHARGVAYKQQIRSDDLDIPILLRDEAYSRAETLVLVHLRTVYQRESTAGEPSARVDIEDVEQTVLTYFAEADGDTARRQRAIRGALARLRQDGVIDEESEGRYRVSPLVEILLSSQRLRELQEWLTEQTARSHPIDLDDEPDSPDDGHDSADSDNAHASTAAPSNANANANDDEGGSL